MASLVWYHFCEKIITESDGKNSYLSVFDRMTVGIRKRPGTPDLPDPLPYPIPTQRFVLAMHLSVRPSTREPVEIRVRDSDGEEIMPPHNVVLGKNPEGKCNLNMTFTNGIPVMRTCIYSFEIRVAGQKMQIEPELPVTIRIE